MAQQAEPHAHHKSSRCAKIGKKEYCNCLMKSEAKDKAESVFNHLKYPLIAYSLLASFYIAR